MELAQETKPKMKNIIPISMMEIWVSLWVKELTDTGFFMFLNRFFLAGLIYIDFLKEAIIFKIVPKNDQFYGHHKVVFQFLFF